MPDDEPAPSNDASDFSSGGDADGSAPSFAPDHDSDQQNPKPGSEEQNQIVTPQQMQDKMKAFQSGLNSVLTQQRANQADHFQMMRQIQQMQQEEKQAPPEPPALRAYPVPPDQQQKNQIAVLGTNILKWGALLGLAYGLTRRSPARGAMFKLALGSALQSYQEGDNRNRNRSVKAWEENTRAINEQNKEQWRQYQETLRNKHTGFQEKMELLKAQAQVWRNDRVEAAAIQRNMMEVEHALDGMTRMQQHFQEQMKKDREQWYKLFGMTAKEGYNYRDWVLSKGGPDPNKAKNADEESAIEKKYPRSQMIDEQSKAEDQRKFEQREKEKESDKARALDLHKQEKDYDAKLQQSGGASPDDPNAPITDQKAKEMRDKIFGGSDSD